MRCRSSAGCDARARPGAPQAVGDPSAAAALWSSEKWIWERPCELTGEAHAPSSLSWSWEAAAPGHPAQLPAGAADPLVSQPCPTGHQKPRPIQWSGLSRVKGCFSCSSPAGKEGYQLLAYGTQWARGGVVCGGGQRWRAKPEVLWVLKKIGKTHSSLFLETSSPPPNTRTHASPSA